MACRGCGLPNGTTQNRTQRDDEMEQPKRKMHRLQNFDYSQNASYFVTICTENRQRIFGKIINGTVYHNPMGKIACREIDATNEKRKNHGIAIEKFVVMPDHVHMIITVADAGVSVDESRGNGFSKAVANSVGSIVGGYKSAVTRNIRKWAETFGSDTASHVPTTIWQFKYYDHVIRGQEDYRETWEYIDTNPLRWELKQQGMKEGSL